MKKNKLQCLAIVALCTFMLSACVGRVVGAVVDTTIEVAKIPFKVGGAVIDVATPDKKKQSKRNDDDEDEEDAR